MYWINGNKWPELSGTYRNGVRVPTNTPSLTQPSSQSLRQLRNKPQRSTPASINASRDPSEIALTLPKVRTRGPVRLQSTSGTTKVSSSSKFCASSDAAAAQWPTARRQSGQRTRSWGAARRDPKGQARPGRATYTTFTFVYYIDNSN